MRLGRVGWCVNLTQDGELRLHLLCLTGPGPALLALPWERISDSSGDVGS